MIRIAERYRPFSHKPGSSCLVPGTEFVVDAFPTLIRVKKHNETLSELPIILKKAFLLTQDLEQGFVSVSGEFFVGQSGDISLKKPAPRPHEERISLGSSKAQNWDYVRQRKDLKEILPLWHKLAGFYDYAHPIPQDHYLNLYLSYFNSYFVPRVNDEEHQGLFKEALEKPFTLFSQKGVRSFIFEETDEILIKRNPFSSGRIINAKTAMGIIHYEWTKNFPRRFLFDGDISKLQVTFPPEVSQYRVTNTDKGLMFDKFE